MSRLRFFSRLHGALSSYVRPKTLAVGSTEYELAGQFSTLIALASILLPFFVVEFLSTGFDAAAIAMTVAGAAMLSTVVVYRLSGDVRLAREVFLFALFVFLVWESCYFGTIYNPGTVWFAVPPVVSILLGSAVSGIFWLLAGVVALTLVYFFATSPASAAAVLEGDFTTLYAASIVVMMVAIFLFVQMVDSARHAAIRRLAEANDTNRHLAESDDLTGLLNRRALHLQMASLLERAGSSTVEVLFTDLDDFKDINDTFGHDAGDLVLQKAAELLESLCKSGEVVLARLGGDEFAFVIANANDAAAATNLARAAVALFEAPFKVLDQEIQVGISIGSARASGALDASELMRRADLAMYEAKRQGGGRHCKYEPEMDAQRSVRTVMAAELARALSSGQIEVHYQPIVNSASRTMTGVEALARWRRANGEQVPPDVFIPIAEGTGLINSLGMHVLETACIEARAWSALKLSVNVSPVQFRSPTVVEDILGVLLKTGFPADRLELEVTEGYLIEHRDRARPIIAALRNSGIKIALDDFGSGYSSIGYLREYAFDRLKLDKSITQGLNDAAARGIVQATTLLAKSFLLSVTAEGVETHEQARILHLAGCDDLQGYYFGKACPAPVIDSIVASSAGTLPQIRRGAAQS